MEAAHRLGQSRQNAPPPIIVRFHTRDSDSDSDSELFIQTIYSNKIK